MDYIYKKNEKIKNDLDKLVVAIFYYSANSWTIAFCSNVVELVEKYKVLDDKEEFVQWTEFYEIPSYYPFLEVYLEKSLIPELMINNIILIDAIIGETNSDENLGFFFIKKQNDVYG